MTFTNSNNNDKSSNSSVTITPIEFQQLRRVFENLCFFADKVQIREKIQTIDEKLREIQQKHPEQYNSICSTLSSSRKSCSSTFVLKEITTLQTQRAKCKKELQDLKKTMSASTTTTTTTTDQQYHPQQYIRSQDIAAAMKSLGKKMTKKQAHDIVWEVDEKLDQVIDWEEFKLMFERNIRDMTGLEPASLYHMVQFMIYDRNDNGMVSIDEMMNLLYARLGRVKMEKLIGKLFGGNDGAPIKEVGRQGGEIDFLRYWEVVEKEQVKMFNESELGRMLAEKKRRRK